MCAKSWSSPAQPPQPELVQDSSLIVPSRQHLSRACSGFTQRPSRHWLPPLRQQQSRAATGFPDLKLFIMPEDQPEMDGLTASQGSSLKITCPSLRLQAHLQRLQGPGDFGRMALAGELGPGVLPECPQRAGASAGECPCLPGGSPCLWEAVRECEHTAVMCLESRSCLSDMVVLCPSSRCSMQQARLRSSMLHAKQKQHEQQFTASDNPAARWQRSRA